MSLRPPDAIVRVRLFPAEAGGRKAKLAAVAVRIPVFFGEQRAQANDCRERLVVGARFTRWDGRDIDEAEVVQVPR